MPSISQNLQSFTFVLSFQWPDPKYRTTSTWQTRMTKSNETRSVEFDLGSAPANDYLSGTTYQVTVVMINVIKFELVPTIYMLYLVINFLRRLIGRTVVRIILVIGTTVVRITFVNGTTVVRITFVNDTTVVQIASAFFNRIVISYICSCMVSSYLWSNCVTCYT